MYKRREFIIKDMYIRYLFENGVCVSYTGLGKECVITCGDKIKQVSDISNCLLKIYCAMYIMAGVKWSGSYWKDERPSFVLFSCTLQAKRYDDIYLVCTGSGDDTAYMEVFYLNDCIFRGDSGILFKDLMQIMELAVKKCKRFKPRKEVSGEK